MVGTCTKNGSGSNAKKDDGRKTVHRQKKRKTLLEMDRWYHSRLESNEDQAVDGEDEEQRAMETGCWGGQGSPRTVAPRGWLDGSESNICLSQHMRLAFFMTWDRILQYIIFICGHCGVKLFVYSSYVSKDQVLTWANMRIMEMQKHLFLKI